MFQGLRDRGDNSGMWGLRLGVTSRVWLGFSQVSKGVQG